MSNEKPEKRRSRAWYILPIIFHLFGGVISYFAVRKDDPVLAKNCLKIGAILLALHLGIGIGAGLFSSSAGM